MQIVNTKDAYGWAAIALHWLVVIAVVTMFSLGLLAEAASEAGDRALRATYMRTHIGFGVFVVLLVFVRIFWSLTQPRPAPLGAPSFLNTIARLVHVVLLLGLLTLVISGPLAVWSGGRAIDVFGWFALPSPFAESNDAVHEAAEIMHAVGRFTVFFAVLLHVLGALKHLLIDRDRTVQRMLWVRN
jgi:cytochrome b561